MAIRGVQEVVDKMSGVFEIGAEKDAVDLLKADHRKVEALFSQFERSRNASSKQEILDRIIILLTIHTTVEENLVYPLLEDSRRTADKTADAYEQHHVVKMLLAELAAMSAADDSVKAKMRVLKELVSHHIREEEMSLLPQLRRSGTDLERLATDITRRKQQLVRRTPGGARVGAKTEAKTVISGKARSTKQPAEKAPVGRKSGATKPGQSSGQASARRSAAVKKTTKPAIGTRKRSA